MKTIGVISDTHISSHRRRVLPPQVFEHFANVDYIIHTGDLNTLEVVAELEKLAPVVAVTGNNDNAEAMNLLPPSRRFEVEQSVLGLAHGHVGIDNLVRPFADAPGNSQTAANAFSIFEFEDDVNCVIFGHSHLPLIKWHEHAGRRILLFNPGSPTDKRFGPHYALGLLRIDGVNIEPQLVKW